MGEKNQQREKIVYMVTRSGEHAELALLPFMHAVGALTLDVDAVVVLMADAVWLAKKDYAKHITYPGKPPLDELIANLLEMGGKILVCTPCIKSRKIGEDELVQGAEPIAAARFTQEVLSANAVLSY